VGDIHRVVRSGVGSFRALLVVSGPIYKLDRLANLLANGMRKQTL
jgi:hypothetical protein